MFSDIRNDFLTAVFYMGGRPECKTRIIESCRRAINYGDDWRDVLDSVRRNRPELFSNTLAAKQQRG
jgi:hypothetical protein